MDSYRIAKRFDALEQAVKSLQNSTPASAYVSPTAFDVSPKIDALRSELETLIARFDILEEKLAGIVIPDIVVPDVSGLDTRISALEAKPEVVVPDVSGLDARISALEEKPEPIDVHEQVSLLEERVSALECADEE